MTEVPRRYDPPQDKWVPVTQEWVDKVEAVLKTLRQHHAALQYLGQPGQEKR